MKWNSVRVRLTLWHVAVLAMVLVGFALALCYSVRTSLAAAVDQELADRAHVFVSRWAQDLDSPFRPGGGTGGFPAFPGGGPSSMGSEPGSFPAEPREFRPPVPPSGSEAERRGFYRRPRILDLDGHPLVPLSGDEPWDITGFQLSVGGKEIYLTINLEGERVRVFSTPLPGPDGPEGVVQVAHPLTEQDRLNAGLVRTLLTLIPLALLVAGIGGVFLTDRALRPVRQITHAAAQISAQDLSRRLVVTGKDELSELASTFNGMIGRLDEAFSELERAYEQQRRFTGDASHELRTPLTAIKANTSFALSGDRTPEELREALVEADEAADTMSRIVQDLLLLARSDSGQLNLMLEPTDLQDVLRRAAASVQGRSPAPIRIELPETPLGVRGDSHHLVRLFVNLLENASRHTPAEGQITVSAREAAGEVEVRVRDTGEGIAPEHLPHVCERFYRVDSARARAQGGTGLGLAICRSIVQAHGGTLRIASELGQGTTVEVTLPAARLDREPETLLAGVA